MGFSYHDLERAAAGYVLEDENWHPFLTWMRERVVPEDAAALAAAPPEVTLGGLLRVRPSDIKAFTLVAVLDDALPVIMTCCAKRHAVAMMGRAIHLMSAEDEGW